MAVVILILKIIGLVLLVLLGLVLFCAGLILFVPVRYRISGSQTAGFDTASVQARATWLLHLVSFRMEYSGGETESVLKICGIRRKKKASDEEPEEWEEDEFPEEPAPRRADAAGGRKQDPGAGSGPDKRADAAGGRKQDPGAGSSPDKKPDAAGGRKPDPGAGSVPDKKPAAADRAGSVPDKKPAEVVREEADLDKQMAVVAREESSLDIGTPAVDRSDNLTTGIKEAEVRSSEESGRKRPAASGQTGRTVSGYSRIAAAFRSVFLRIVTWMRRIAGRIRHIWELIRGIPERLRRQKASAARMWAKLLDIKSAISDETNRTAVFGILAELRYLLSHFRFRKIDTDLSFSLGDPAATGQALGAVSMLPFLYRYRCGVYPDFDSEEAYVRGTFEIRGRARILHLLRSLIRLWRKREVRVFVRRIMKR